MYKGPLEREEKSQKLDAYSMSTFPFILPSFPLPSSFYPITVSGSQFGSLRTHPWVYFVSPKGEV